VLACPGVVVRKTGVGPATRLRGVRCCRVAAGCGRAQRRRLGMAGCRSRGDVGSVSACCRSRLGHGKSDVGFGSARLHNLQTSSPSGPVGLPVGIPPVRLWSGLVGLQTKAISHGFLFAPTALRCSPLLSAALRCSPLLSAAPLRPCRVASRRWTTSYTRRAA
jgi:hypothetical protein